MAFLDDLVGWLERLPRQEELPRVGPLGAEPDAEDGPSAYAEELRLASRARGAWARLPMGDVLLKLKGRARIKWLLHVELAQSVGLRDPWRLSREGLIEAVRQQRSWTQQDLAEQDFPAPLSVMARWESIGIWSLSGDHERVGFDLGEPSALLLEVLSDPPEPLAALALAMSRDQEGEDLGDVSAPLYAPATARSALEEFARNTRHELANRLIPLQTVVASLVSELRRAGVAEDRVDQLEQRAVEKVDYLFRFARGLSEMVETAQSPVSLFSLEAVVSDAIQSTQAERNGRVTVQVLASLGRYELRGARQQVVDALVNLIRNAAQSRPEGPVRVDIDAVRQGPDLSLTLDDDGPGIPADLRQRVFVPGYSTRGGSGLGLAIVERAAVAMGGTARCEESPLGGARFTLRLPLQERGGRNT